jgi:uncharacterized protein YbaP (TraB family)
LKLIDWSGFRGEIASNTASILVFCILCLGAPPAFAQPAVERRPSSQTVEPVLVTAEQPGPGMWKITRGGNLMWIVGTHTPVPKDLKWRSKAVEAAVASANEVLSAPSATVSSKQLGFFTSLTLIPSALNAPYNPDDKPLREVLPPPLHARWEILRDKYLAGYNDTNNEIDRWRPWFAATRLYSAALDKLGLQNRDPVWPRVTEAAKKARVKITNVTYSPPIKDPRAAIKEFNANPMADLDCFTRTLDRIETDLDAMKIRANAWARGDVDAIRKRPEIDHRAACILAMRQSPLMKMIGNVDPNKVLQDTWVEQADAALSRNKVTVAVLPIAPLVAANGYLDALRALGAGVEEPE